MHAVVADHGQGAELVGRQEVTAIRVAVVAEDRLVRNRRVVVGLLEDGIRRVPMVVIENRVVGVPVTGHAPLNAVHLLVDAVAGAARGGRDGCQRLADLGVEPVLDRLVALRQQRLVAHALVLEVGERLDGRRDLRHDGVYGGELRVDEAVDALLDLAGTPQARSSRRDAAESEHERSEHEHAVAGSLRGLGPRETRPLYTRCLAGKKTSEQEKLKPESVINHHGKEISEY